MYSSIKRFRVKKKKKKLYEGSFIVARADLMTKAVVSFTHHPAEDALNSSAFPSSTSCNLSSVVRLYREKRAAVLSLRFFQSRTHDSSVVSDPCSTVNPTSGYIDIRDTVFWKKVLPLFFFGFISHSAAPCSFFSEENKNETSSVFCEHSAVGRGWHGTMLLYDPVPVWTCNLF